MFAFIRSFLLVLAIPIVLCGCEAANTGLANNVKDWPGSGSVETETCFYAPVDMGENFGAHMRRLCFKGTLLDVYVTQYGFRDMHR
jgi:hypothetical protein